MQAHTHAHMRAHTNTHTRARTNIYTNNAHMHTTLHTMVILTKGLGSSGPDTPNSSAHFLLNDNFSPKAAATPVEVAATSNIKIL